MGYSPLTMWMSVPQMVVRRIWTIASRSPARGIGFSSSPNSPGPRKTLAFIRPRGVCCVLRCSSANGIGIASPFGVLQGDRQMFDLFKPQGFQAVCRPGVDLCPNGLRDIPHPVPASPGIVGSWGAGYGTSISMVRKGGQADRRAAGKLADCRSEPESARRASRTDPQGSPGPSHFGIDAWFGLRRGEVAGLKVDHLQQREEHRVIADLIGKAAHIIWPVAAFNTTPTASVTMLNCAGLGTSMDARSAVSPIARYPCW